MSAVPTLYDIAASGNPLAGILAAKVRVQAAADRIAGATVPVPLPKLELPDLPSLAKEFRVDGWGLYISQHTSSTSVGLTTPKATGSVERDFIADLSPKQILAVTVRVEGLASCVEALANEQERLAASTVERALRDNDQALRGLAERAATAEAAKAAAQAERHAWIATNGSAHLRRLVTEKIEHGGLYMSERMACDRSNWRVWNDVSGDDHEPRNPPTDALVILDEARKVEAESRLVYVTVDHDHDDCDDEDKCPRYDWTGYAALAEFLGRTIVFGGPA